MIAATAGAAPPSIPKRLSGNSYFNEVYSSVKAMITLEMIIREKVIARNHAIICLVLALFGIIMNEMKWFFSWWIFSSLSESPIAGLGKIELLINLLQLFNCNNRLGFIFSEAINCRFVCISVFVDHYAELRKLPIQSDALSRLRIGCY
ncbi:hypothetical protein P9112_008794 [Eukaryota sp. TZLM1-RC]